MSSFVRLRKKRDAPLFVNHSLQLMRRVVEILVVFVVSWFIESDVCTVDPKTDFAGPVVHLLFLLINIQRNTCVKFGR